MPCTPEEALVPVPRALLFLGQWRVRVIVIVSGTEQVGVAKCVSRVPAWPGGREVCMWEEAGTLVGPLLAPPPKYPSPASTIG